MHFVHDFGTATDIAVELRLAKYRLVEAIILASAVVAFGMMTLT